MDQSSWSLQPDRSGSRAGAQRQRDEIASLRRATIAAAWRCMNRIALQIDGAPARCVKAACRRSGCCRGDVCLEQTE